MRRRPADRNAGRCADFIQVRLSRDKSLQPLLEMTSARSAPSAARSMPNAKSGCVALKLAPQPSSSDSPQHRHDPSPPNRSFVSLEGGRDDHPLAPLHNTEEGVVRANPLTILC